MPIKSHKSKSKSPLPKAVNIPSKYSYENMMKKHQLKHANIQFRNDLLKSRANAAYKNEYDRVNNILHNHILNNSSPSHYTLVERREQVKRLVADGLYPQHELFKKDEK